MEEPVEGYDTTYTNNGLVGGQDVKVGVTNSKDEGPDKQTAFKISKNLSEDGSIKSDVVEGAKFVLKKADGSALGNVYAGKPEELASLRANVHSADSAITEGDASKNYKAIEISGCTEGTGYTIIGDDLSFFQVDGSDVSSMATRNPITNKYEYRGTISGSTLRADGFTQGNYRIEFADGAEYKINAKGADTSITVADDVLVNKKAALADNSTFEFIGGEIEINNLPAGRYTLEETASPNGYEKVTTVFTFDVNDEGKVSLADVYSDGEITVSADGSQISVGDKVSEVQVIKYFDRKPNTRPAVMPGWPGMPAQNNGAELELKFVSADTSKGDVTIAGADTLAVGESVTWNTNDENPKSFKGLKDGTYELVENSAPGSYKKIETVKTIVIKDGVITEGGDSEDGSASKEASLINTMRQRIILSKTAVDSTGAEVSLGTNSATFTIEGLDGLDIKRIKVNDHRIEEADLVEGKYTFTGNEIAFEDLKTGSYKISEITPPDGFTAISDFTFNFVKGTGWNATDKVTSVTPSVEGEAKLEDGKIIVVDKKSNIKLSKQAIDENSMPVELDSTNTATFFISGANLEGVKVGEHVITADEASGSYMFTGNDVTFEGLKDGVYTLTEYTAPDGYTVASSFEFKVEKGKAKLVSASTDGEYDIDSKGNIIVKDKISTISLDKKTLGGEPLAEGNEAEFILKSVAADKLIGVKVGDVTIAADTEGYSDNAYTFRSNSETFVGLKDGEYILVENASPDGYQKVTTEFRFTVENGVIKNNPSVESEGNTISSPDGKSIIVTDDISTIEISKKAIDGSDNEISLDSEDEKQVAEFTLKMTADADNNDETSPSLEGVKVNGTAITAEDIEDNSYTFKSNDTVFKGLKDGTYELTEVTAPEGFERVTTTFRFVIKDGVITESSTIGTTGDTKTVIAADGTKKIVATDKISTVSIDKSAVDGSGAPVDLSAGGEAQKATFTLISKDNGKLEGVKVGGNVLTAEDIEDNGYTFTGNSTKFEGLKDGDYTLREEVAPDGFTVVSEFDFSIKDGKVVLGEASTTGEYDIDDNGNLVITDKISTINVSKEALGSKPLADDNKATFTLTMTKDADEDDTTAPSLKGVTVKPKNGRAEVLEDVDTYTFTSNDATFEGLKDGTYELKEVTAPDGYKKVESTFTFVVENGAIKSSTAATTGNSVIKVENGTNKIVATDDISTIVINKKAIDGTSEEGADLDSTDASQLAEFTLKGEDLEGVIVNDEELTADKIVDNSYTFTGNSTKFEGLKDGTYTLVEKTAPDGYTAIGVESGESVVSEFTFEIKEGQVVVKDVPTTTGAVKIKEDGTIIVLDETSTIEISKEAFGSSSC